MDSATLAARLAANPHNIYGIDGSPPLSAHDYWAAQFEREGCNARQGAPCPYAPGTMAATRWAVGHERQHVGAA